MEIHKTARPSGEDFDGRAGLVRWGIIQLRAGRGSETTKLSD